MLQKQGRRETEMQTSYARLTTPMVREAANNEDRTPIASSPSQQSYNAQPQPHHNYSNRTPQAAAAVANTASVVAEGDCAPSYRLAAVKTPAEAKPTDPSLLPANAWPLGAAEHVLLRRETSSRNRVRTARAAKKCLSFAPLPTVDDNCTHVKRQHKEYEDYDRRDDEEDESEGDENEYNYDSELSNGDPRYIVLAQRPSAGHGMYSETAVRPQQIVHPRPGKPKPTWLNVRSRLGHEDHRGSYSVIYSSGRPWADQLHLFTVEDQWYGNVAGNRKQESTDDMTHIGNRRQKTPVQCRPVNMYNRSASADLLCYDCVDHQQQQSTSRCRTDERGRRIHDYCNVYERAPHQSAANLTSAADNVETCFVHKPSSAAGDYEYLQSHQLLHYQPPFAMHERAAFPITDGRGSASIGTVAKYNCAKGSKRNSCWNICVRLLGSCIAAILFGTVIFLGLLYCTGLTTMPSSVIAIFAAVLAFLLLCTSRLCRCLAAIQIFCVATPIGCKACIILLSGLLLTGPVANMHFNMVEVSRCLDCNSQRIQRQAHALLRPFHDILEQLIDTVQRLHSTAMNITHGFTPLGERMVHAERGSRPTHFPLLGTGETCEAVLKRAFNDCSVSISYAHRKCDVTLSTLGYMSVATKQLLENLDFAHMFQPISDHQAYKRNSPTMPSKLARNEKYPCDILNTTICSELSRWRISCRSAHLMGETIGETINSTLDAIKSVQAMLHLGHQTNSSLDLLNISSIFRDDNIHLKPVSVRENRWTETTQIFGILIRAAAKATLFAFLLLVHTAYEQTKKFLSAKHYNNTHITDQFRAYDRLQKEHSLLPLKNSEKQYLQLAKKQYTTNQVAPALTLHILLAIALHLLDLALWLILQAIRDHAQLQAYESRLQDINLKQQHGHPYLAYDPESNCLPVPHLPSVASLIVTVTIYALLMLAVVFRTQLFDRCILIIGYFYEERQNQRAIELYHYMAQRRSRLSDILKKTIQQRYFENIAGQCFSQKFCAATFTCKFLQSTLPCCLGCETYETNSFIYCDTEKCKGVYCSSCYLDLAAKCPLCH